MKRGFALVGILLLLSGGVAEARLPQVGDVVTISTDLGMYSVVYFGIVTNVTENLIGLNCSNRHTQAPSGNIGKPEIIHEDVALGVASIRSIYWGA